MFAVETCRTSGILALPVSHGVNATNFRVLCSPGYVQNLKLSLTRPKVVFFIFVGVLLQGK